MDPTQSLTSLATTIQQGKNPLADLNITANTNGQAAAQDFEAFFLSQMVSYMMAGVETDPVFGGGPGETMFRSMLSQEYGKTLAQNGGVGIADSVMREILQIQEQAQQ